jgi:putative DNA primase/helicase
MMVDETSGRGLAEDQQRAAMLAAIEERIKAEQAEPAKEGGKDPRGAGPVVTRELIRDCIHQGERGAGIVAAILSYAFLRFDISRKAWLFFNGVHLEIDKTRRAEAFIPEAAAVAFLNEAAALHNEAAAAAGGDKDRAKEIEKQRKKTLSLAGWLRTEHGRQNCLKLAITNGVCDLGISGGEIDQQAYPIPCFDAVIDARTGEPRRESKISDFLLRASPVPWRGINCPAPAWERFLSEIMDGDLEMVGFIQRALGSALIRKRTGDHIFIFSGRGRGGKTTLLETVCDALGDLASPLPAAMFIDQGGRGSSAGSATPELEILRGLALGYCSEVDADKRLAQGASKRITGGDSLVSRGLFGAFEKLKNTWTIFLLLNDVPAAPESDYALWQRLLVVKFPLSYVADREPAADFERRADPQLGDKLQSELSGVLAWLIRGTIAFTQRGLDPPPKVMEEVEAERAENDFLTEFLLACCNQAGHLAEGSTELFQSFSEWWETTGRPVKYKPSQRAFGKALLSKGFHRARDKHGRFFYHGVALQGGAE